MAFEFTPAAYKQLFHKIIFIDESGNTSIATEKEGTSKLYIPAAIIINNSSWADSLYKANEISKKYFQRNPIKSSSVSKEDKRIAILEEINNIDFDYIFFVIDKSLIKKDSGLAYRDSFYKFINRKLYEAFLSRNAKLQIFVDRYGGTDFQRSFIAYIEKYFSPDLYNQPEIGYISGKDDNLIGVADFLSGTIRSLLEGNIKHTSKVKELIKRRCIGMDRWPQQPTVTPEHEILEYDDLIRAVSLKNVRSFLDLNLKSADEYVRMQCAVLNKLSIDTSLEVEAKRGVYTEELIDHLETLHFDRITERVFRQKIIGPLRDMGVLISGTACGYYLATTLADINKFLSHGVGIISPMLRRVKKARDTLLKESDNTCDILSHPIENARTLKMLLEALKDQKVGLNDIEDDDVESVDTEGMR
jgi:hypothetical protein